jgi:hypothetical protein
VVQHVPGPESCTTPAATPGAYAVEDQTAVVGSHEAANRTGSTVLETAYNETASITDTLDPDVILDPLVTTDDLLDTSSYAPETEYPQQAGEEDHTISIGSAAGSDQLGTRSLESSERRWWLTIEFKGQWDLQYLPPKSATVTCMETATQDGCKGNHEEQLRMAEAFRAVMFDYKGPRQPHARC